MLGFQPNLYVQKLEHKTEHPTYLLTRQLVNLLTRQLVNSLTRQLVN